MTPFEFNVYQKKWASENKERLRLNSKRCYEKHKERYRKLNGIKMKLDRRKQRLAVLTYYGAKCNRCGFDKDPRALHVDHIHNDGWKSYGKERKGQNLPRDLVTGTVKWENFQILCANCNVIKAAEVLEVKQVEKYGREALEKAGLLCIESM